MRLSLSNGGYNGFYQDGSAWNIDFSYILVPFTLGRKWYFYNQMIAFVAFFLLIALYFMVRRIHTQLRYLIAGLSVIAAAYISTPYIRPLIFWGKFDMNGLAAYFKVMNWGYYLSTIFAIAIVVWMFWDSYQIRKQSNSQASKMS